MAEGMRLTLAEAATAVGGTLHGPDRTFGGLFSDSRRPLPGALFVALRGPRFDGHAYLAETARGGAAGALVERVVDADLPQVRVADTLAALGRLAVAWRARFDLPLVAVTGSNGKTTVKEMLGAIFSGLGPTLTTTGNLNNAIGLPLTLARLDAGHRYAVLEMGANHPGEIAYLTGLAHPTVALVNNAGPAHLEGFGSLEGVARAKGEAFSAMPEDATAVINADDAFAPLWRELCRGRRVLEFGLSQGAGVSAREVREQAQVTRFHLLTPAGAAAVALHLPGRHNLSNALAAAAAALAAGVAPQSIAAGLERARPVAGRLTQLTGPNGVMVIDDTYNANPASLEAALAVLTASAAQRGGEAVLVLGDMAELGDQAQALHGQMGRAARTAGVQRLLASGELARSAAEAFGRGGEWRPDVQALAAALSERLVPGSTVLVKGSRRAGMERVVRALTQAAPVAEEG